MYLLFAARGKSPGVEGRVYIEILARDVITASLNQGSVGALRGRVSL